MDFKTLGIDLVHIGAMLLWIACAILGMAAFGLIVMGLTIPPFDDFLARKAAEAGRELSARPFEGVPFFTWAAVAAAGCVLAGFAAKTVWRRASAKASGEENA